MYHFHVRLTTLKKYDVTVKLITKSSHCIFNHNWSVGQCRGLRPYSHWTIWYLFSKLSRINKMGWVCLDRISSTCCCLRLVFKLMLIARALIGCWSESIIKWTPVWKPVKDFSLPTDEIFDDASRLFTSSFAESLNLSLRQGLSAFWLDSQLKVYKISSIFKPYEVQIKSKLSKMKSKEFQVRYFLSSTEILVMWSVTNICHHHWIMNS